MNEKKINLTVPEDLWKEIRIEAIKRGMSTKDLVVKGLEWILGRLED